MKPAAEVNAANRGQLHLLEGDTGMGLVSRKLVERALEREEERTRLREVYVHKRKARRITSKERSRRRRRSGSTSDSQSSSGSDFHEARLEDPSRRSVRDAAKAGRALVEGMSNMQRYLAQRSAVGRSEDPMPPVAVTYLEVMLLPSLQTKISNEDARELRTLAEVLDRLVSGELLELGGTIMRRFQAAELALRSSWSVARHLEVIPEPGVSSIDSSTRRKAIRQEARDARELNLMEGSAKAG